MKKTLTLLLMIILTIISLLACDLDLDIEGPDNIDKTKTQLYVGVYDGALGFEWLKEYKKAYEALHPTIEIIIDNKKADYSDGSLLGKIATSRQDLYFLSHNNYSTFVDMRTCLRT